MKHPDSRAASPHSLRRLQLCLGCAAAFLLLPASASFGQSTEETPAPVGAAEGADEDVLVLNTFVVTAVSMPGVVTKMQTSVSVSSLTAEQLVISVPRNTSEIFRSLPAIRSEATAGDSNTNMTARGLPLSTGGSQYVQIQEDGAPILQFGDVAFATADTFLRADATLGSIEAVRGGSASTYATSAPGGVINLISKTGETTSGSIGLVHGLDFDTSRVDFEYGSPVGDDYNFHVGGFHRTGEGSRDTGFKGYNGGQLKLNFTRKFEGGFVRLYFKRLDDSGPTYMPMPTRVTGTNGSPDYGNPGRYDILRDTQYTPWLRRDLNLDADGRPVSSDVTEGVRARSTSIGADFNFKLGDGLHLSNRLNFASNSGRFIAPFPADVLAAQSLADAIGGNGATLWYATGPDAGSRITNPAALNANGLLTRAHIFNTTLNDMGLFSNNLKLNKSIRLENDARVNLGLGYYTSRQDIDQDWNWNSYLMEVGPSANLIDVRAAAAEGAPASSGELRTERGLIAYGVPAWGWFARKYDLTYDMSTPSLNIGYVSDRLSADVSVRRDSGEVRGAKFDSTPTRAVIDMNGDGVISYVESLGAQRIDVTAPAPIVNYDFNGTSYSGGLNYSFSKQVAAFGRYSKGFAIRADRLVDAGNVLADGSIPENDVAFNVSKQFELGVKYRPESLGSGNLAFFVTFFNAKTDEANTESAVGRPQLILRTYEANGIEFETAYRRGGFDVRGSLTWTDAEITAANDPTVVGHRPRRQARFVYSVAPTYTYKWLNLGLSVIGTTDAYTQDSNQLVMPGYYYVNGSVGFRLSEALSLSLSVNNLFDKVGISEAEEGSLPASGIVRARSIPGRTTSVGLKYTF